jgi:hypothetical protein
MANINNRHGFVTGWFIDSNEQPVNFADIISSVYFNGNHDVLVTMDNVTKRTLDGDAYRLSSKISGLTTGNSSHIEIQTGDNKVYVTAVLFAPSDGGIDITLKEGASISGGTSNSVPVYNVDRTSTNTLDVSFTSYDNAATVTGGTIIERLYLPGTGKDSGENFVTGLRFILKPNTTYVRTITNNSGGDVDVGVGAEFYEFP